MICSNNGPTDIEVKFLLPWIQGHPFWGGSSFAIWTHATDFKENVHKKKRKERECEITRSLSA